MCLSSHLNSCFQAFDQQQQDLIDAASKALSFRQDIIEENIRLTYALQVAFMRYIMDCIIVSSFDSQLTVGISNMHKLDASYACFPS